MTQERAEVPTADDLAQQAVAHVSHLVEAAQLNASVKLTSLEGDIVNIDIDGEDASLLIGRRGQVLDALQYLVLVMTTHDKYGSNRLRIHLDADGYRQRRADSLRDLARSLADQVRATGEEAVIEPLNALERRIVHTELVDDPDVETYSEGEEPHRHIVITPRRSDS
ncbi:MAG: RNA-binding cell elongation regulator Jag/EloR [Capsulimonadaceae bacterium]|nr:RNA-binding cell elongation regulator Jag/EloR [Capsulimonadaceae bacterium]